MYEEADGDSEANLYVHHDIMLPAFPLAVAWLDCDPAGLRAAANMAAVGSYDTGIEIWDLDVLDSVEPAAVLGGPVAGGSVALAAAEAAAGKGKSKKVWDLGRKFHVLTFFKFEAPPTRASKGVRIFAF